MDTNFDERYEIRLANLSDVNSIMRYIDNVWRAGHIMSVDLELFLYEFAHGEDVNVLLAIDRESNEIEAFYGFLNCSDPNNTANAHRRDIWGSMWKVNDAHPNLPMLGVELAKRITLFVKCRTVFGNGANPGTTIPLRKIFFREKTVKLKHFYFLNNSISDFKIAVINMPFVSKGKKTKEASSLVKFENFNDLKNHFDAETVDVVPFKDNWYVNKRYFCHPYYEYIVYGIADTLGTVKALLFTREISESGAKVLRIVDYIGEHAVFAGLYTVFEKLITDNNYEYIDFYQHGFDDGFIESAGFVLKTEDDPNVIPNYFEPFHKANVDIWAHYKLDGTLVFKADGDQDRPNIAKTNTP
jgi:hypothetical protein